MFEKVAVHARKRISNPDVFRNVVSLLKEMATEICFTENAQLYYDKKIPEVDFEKKYDFFLVFGGDGSILKVIHNMKNFDTPILGISAGTLGFLSEIPPEDFFHASECIAKNNYTLDSRMLLEITLHSKELGIQKYHALNEIVVSQSSIARMVSVETYVNDEFLTTYRADGLIVSSPTGSTAYSLSAGGPILHPRFEAMILTPISPHSLTHIPLIIPGDRKVAVMPDATNRVGLNLTVDGQVIIPLHIGDKVEVTASSQKINFLRLPEEHFFGTIKRKLHWGGGG